MELKLEKRTAGLKSALGKVRRDGNIPAVMYAKGKESEPVYVNGLAFSLELRNIPKGCLATKIFDIDFGGKKMKAIIKDISYHRTTYAIEHIDLMIVEPNDRITLHVPIVCKGEDVCPGITQGGQLKQVKRSVKMRMPVKEIPESFVLNVGHLNLGDNLRVRDLPVSENVRVCVDAHQILIAVSK